MLKLGVSSRRRKRGEGGEGTANVCGGCVTDGREEEDYP